MTLPLADQAVRPHLLNQFFLGYQMTGAVDQCNEQIERTGAHGYIPVLCEKPTFGRLDGKAAESVFAPRCFTGHLRYSPA
jgi:hypothetical protein